MKVSDLYEECVDNLSPNNPQSGLKSLMKWQSCESISDLYEQCADNMSPNTPQAGLKLLMKWQSCENISLVR